MCIRWSWWAVLTRGILFAVMKVRLALCLLQVCVLYMRAGHPSRGWQNTLSVEQSGQCLDADSCVVNCRPNCVVAMGGGRCGGQAASQSRLQEFPSYPNRTHEHIHKHTYAPFIVRKTLWTAAETTLSPRKVHNSNYQVHQPTSFSSANPVSACFLMPSTGLGIARIYLSLHPQNFHSTPTKPNSLF